MNRKEAERLSEKWYARHIGGDGILKGCVVASLASLLLRTYKKGVKKGVKEGELIGMCKQADAERRMERMERKYAK